MDRRLFVLSAFALGGCASLGSPPSGAAAPAALGELEPLYGAEAGRDGLTLRVKSTGCTAKADFTFYVERRGGTVTVAFARRQVETCKGAVAAAAEIAFSWEELGLSPRTPVFLLNPLAPAGR